MKWEVDTWTLTFLLKKDIRQIREQFINNSHKEIQDYFKMHCPRWPEMDLKELRRTAVFVSQSHKEKQEETNGLLTQIQKEPKSLSNRMEKVEIGHDNE